MLTPRFFRMEEPSPTRYPASDVPFHRKSTVSKTPGSRYPLAISETHLLAQARIEAALTLTARTALAPNGLSTTLHAIQNTCHRPEKPRALLPRPTPLARLFTEARDAADPFTRPLFRDAPSRAPRFRPS